MASPESMRLVMAEWRQLQFRVTYAYDAPVAPHNYVMLGHVAPSYTLWLVRAGAVDLRLPQWREVVTAGHWVLLPPRMVRDQRFTVGAALLSIQFFAGWPGERHLFELAAPLVRPRAAWAELEAAHVALATRAQLRGDVPLTLAEHTRTEALRQAFLAAWCTTLLGEGLVPHGPRELDPRIEAAIGELERCDYQAAIPYPRLCRVSGLGRVQLDRLFVAQTGQTPRQVLQARCLQQVTERLLTTQQPVKQICFELGFASAAHFSNWFRRQVGMSPQAYRAQAG